MNDTIPITSEELRRWYDVIEEVRGRIPIVGEKDRHHNDTVLARQDLDKLSSEIFERYLDALRRCA